MITNGSFFCRRGQLLNFFVTITSVFITKEPKVKKYLLGTVAAILPLTAMAADLPVRAPAVAPVPVVAAPLWTGFYVGLNGGYGGDEFRYPFSGVIVDGETTTPYGGRASVTSSGFLGGAQIGYNYQLNPNWVIGLEADYAFADINGRVDLNGGIGRFDLGVSAGSKVENLGTVRARAGYAMDRALFYVTGGWAWGHIESSLNFGASFMGGGDGFTLSRGKTASGWTIGGGLEYMLTPRVSFKTEYLYVDLGKENLYLANYTSVPGPIDTATARLDVDTRLHLVRAGVNYRF